MRTNRFLYALGIGCTLCACSSHDEPIGGQEEPDYSKSNKYMSVAIVTSNDGTRADDYEDGDPSEYDVNGVGFYFFDRLNNYVDTEYITSADFKTEGVPSTPAVTVMGTVEVELAANRVYDNVIVVLNPNSTLLTKDGDSFVLAKKSKNEILAYNNNYSGVQKSGEKGNFTMSNSVFVDKENYAGDGSEDPYVAVPITSHNIYTKDMNLSEDEKAARAVNIYVERVCSKVVVGDTPTFSSFFVDVDGTQTTLNVMNQTTGKEETVTVKAEFMGMGLSVTSKNAYLLKSLKDLTYNFNTEIKNFVWNDPVQKRSYWETTIGGKSEAQGGGYNYTSWKDMKAQPLTAYINPNTVDALSFDNDEADYTTKLVVCAQLQDGSGQPLDFVKFSGGYWMADYLLWHAAKRSYENLQNLEYKDEATKSKVEDMDVDYIKSQIELVKKNTGSKEAYLAKLAFIKDADFLPGETDTDLISKVKTEIQATLDDITNRQIQYWKNGMTYFYVPIRHEGFSGLGLNDTNYLNGVVRNHVYKIKISKIWGLGTPVIEPGNPIDPERPDDAPDSYMTAKIHVLKWRVVNSEVVLH